MTPDLLVPFVTSYVEAAHVPGKRSVDRGIGCDSDVPDARVEDRARPAAARGDQLDRKEYTDLTA